MVVELTPAETPKVIFGTLVPTIPGPLEGAKESLPKMISDLGFEKTKIVSTGEIIHDHPFSVD